MRLGIYVFIKKKIIMFLVLLSARVKSFSFSRMWDFLFTNLNICIALDIRMCLKVKI